MGLIRKVKPACINGIRGMCGWGDHASWHVTGADRMEVESLCPVLLLWVSVLRVRYGTA